MCSSRNSSPTLWPSSNSPIATSHSYTSHIFPSSFPLTLFLSFPPTLSAPYSTKSLIQYLLPPGFSSESLLYNSSSLQDPNTPIPTIITAWKKKFRSHRNDFRSLLSIYVLPSLIQQLKFYYLFSWTLLYSCQLYCKSLFLLGALNPTMALVLPFFDKPTSRIWYNHFIVNILRTLQLVFLSFPIHYPCRYRFALPSAILLNIAPCDP